MTEAGEYTSLEDVLSYCHGGCSDVESVVIRYYWAEAGPNVAISVLCVDGTGGESNFWDCEDTKFFASGSPDRYVETDHLLSEAELEAMFDAN